MADERLRVLEREARASGDPELLDRLIREQLRAQEGRFFDLTRQLDALHAVELPVMREGLWKVGGALLRDLGAPWRSRAGDHHELVDAYLTRLFPARFGQPLTFQAASGTWLPVAHDEELDPDAFEAAQEEYWKHFGTPWRWTDLRFPAVLRRPAGHDQVEYDFAAPKDLLAGLLSWTINSKLFELERPDGSQVRVPYSSDRSELAEIERQELDHQARVVALVEAFLDGLSPEATFCYSVHVLAEESAKARGWDLFMDEVVAVVDQEHLRVAWAGHDRYYG